MWLSDNPVFLSEPLQHSLYGECHLTAEASLWGTAGPQVLFVQWRTKEHQS